MPVELVLKPRQLHPGGKRQASKLNVSGVTGGKKHKATNGLAASVRAQQQHESRAQTERNRRILVLLPNGKRRFMLLSEYETR